MNFFAGNGTMLDPFGDDEEIARTQRHVPVPHLDDEPAQKEVVGVVVLVPDDALEVFGDSWTLLIVRDLMFKDRTTYTELLRAEEGIATNILADRLVRLARDGIIERDDQRTSGGYRLTAKGIDLLPLMLEV